MTKTTLTKTTLTKTTLTKSKTIAALVDDDEAVSFRPGGTDRAIRELAEATHRLTMRRVRDLLPGKIETKRLVLRAAIRGDVPELVRLADNKNVALPLARMPMPYTRADAVAFIELFSQRPDERPYAITLSGKLIGVVGFSFHEDRPPELGYWLGEPFWGRGYMTEAAKALIEAAHRTGHYEKIGARALESNAGSVNVLTKLGFKRKGGKKKSESPHNLGQPVLVFELARPRWL
jgi:RimJ/RimL family protein N-acetyltransferase